MHPLITPCVSFLVKGSRRSALAKSWAAPDSFSADGHHGRPVSASKATREYDRPWLTGIKKGKARDDHAHPNKENTRQGKLSIFVIKNSHDMEISQYTVVKHSM